MKNIVKELRSALGLSQSKFAKLTGFNSIQQISNLENSKQNVGLGLLNKMIDNMNENGTPATLSIKITIPSENSVIELV
jgi:transcriptional regulator with XRE-family HTH domain